MLADIAVHDPEAFDQIVQRSRTPWPPDRPPGEGTSYQTGHEREAGTSCLSFFSFSGTIMALADFLAELDDLARQATAALDAAANPDALEAARIEFLGAKKRPAQERAKGLGTVDKADKPAAGKRFNEVKELLEAAFEAAKRVWPAPATPSRPPRSIPRCPANAPARATCIRSRRRSRS